MDGPGRTSTEALHTNGHTHSSETAELTGDSAPLPALPTEANTNTSTNTNSVATSLDEHRHEKAHPVAPAASKAFDDVIYSDIGISTMLGRLKQSIASARELALFFKSLSKAEDQKAHALRQLVKTTHRERDGTRQGGYAQQFEAVTSMQERIANNGVQLSLNLSQMENDLNNLAIDKDRERKHWKSTGLTAEDRTLEAERAMEKAKAKYDSLAEDYDGARTGDRSSNHFSLRSIGKNSAQQEEDLQRRVKIADEDYQSKVGAARASRSELHSTGRPQAVRALQQLIEEVDGAVVMQLQKFAAYSEQTILRDGLLLAPGNDGAPGQRGLRDIISDIDNEQDLRTHILSFTSQVPPKKPEIEYRQHPTLVPRAAPVAPPISTTHGTYQQGSETSMSHHPGASTFAVNQPGAMQGPAGTHVTPPMYGTSPTMAHQSPPFGQQQQGFRPGGAPSLPAQSFGRFDEGFGGGSPTTAGPGVVDPYKSRNTGPSTGPPYPDNRGPGPYPDHRGPGHFNGASPTQHQTPGLNGNNTQLASTMYNYGPTSSSGPGGLGGPAAPLGVNGSPNAPRGPVGGAALPLGGPRPTTRDGQRQASPSRRMFGLSLDELFNRDKTPVPLLVIQCIQAVDHFGLSSEGIYRVSGNQHHVNALRSQFDNDAYRVDFRNPESFNHDVHVPANLLKLFFRELPDSLFTRARYDDFIRAAQIDDDAARRDNLHAIINDLPDPNYATLRALILHLHRVDTHSEANRMTPTNLAVIFGPTLMGPHTGMDMGLGALQPKVISTILQNAMQIFDED